MKSFRILLTCAVAVAASGAAASAQSTATLPSAKEVLARYVEVTGGEAALKNITSRTVKGKMMIKEAGIGGSIVTMSVKGGKSYTEVNIDGMGKELQGSDGETYWAVSNFTGTRILEGAEKEQLVKENDFLSDLHPEKYFKSLKVVGTEDVGGDACYKLEKTKNDGDVQTDFYSVKTGLLVKSVMPVTTPVGKLEIVTMVSDYRDVDGMKISFKSEQKLPNNMTQSITLESVEINKKIDDGKFALPDAIQKMKAK